MSDMNVVLQSHALAGQPLAQPKTKCYGGTTGYDQVPCASHSPTSPTPSATASPTPSTIASTSPAAPPPQLAQTGDPTAWITGTGGLLLLFGIGLVVRTRRRRALPRHSAA